MPWLLRTRAGVWLTVRFCYRRPQQAAGHHRVRMLERDGLEVGVLDYQVCHACRVGCINKLSIVPEWQRRGLGRRAIGHALARGRGYAWGTSGQSPDGRQFFAAMARRTGAAFIERAGSCPHIRAAR